MPEPVEWAIVRRFLQELAEGKLCPVCHAEITGKQQDGRCIYAIPCGHRIFQGKLPDNKETSK